MNSNELYVHVGSSRSDDEIKYNRQSERQWLWQFNTKKNVITRATHLYSTLLNKETSNR